MPMSHFLSEHTLAYLCGTEDYCFVSPMPSHVNLPGQTTRCRRFLQLSLTNPTQDSHFLSGCIGLEKCFLIAGDFCALG
jgi:hypothetical protein